MPTSVNTPCEGYHNRRNPCSDPVCPWVTVPDCKTCGEYFGMTRLCGPDCGKVPKACPKRTDVKHPINWRGEHPDWCDDPHCLDVRGYDEYTKRVTEANTLVKLWRCLADVIGSGAPGSEEEKKRQARRFHREQVALKKELTELCRARVIEFIDRWRTTHFPGEE